MIEEYRFHGRGGQGAVTAARLLVGAAHREGRYGQAFPHFGAERRGAPVVAFARISDRPIRVHEQVREPDVVVVLDPTLFKLVNVLEGLREDGVLVVNSKEDPGIQGPYKVFIVDATGIALSLGLRVAGWPVVNTSILGAVVKATGSVSLDSVVDEIKSNWPGRMGEANAQAAKLAYEKAVRVR